MKYILKKPIIEPGTKQPCRGLQKAQLLLESCVEAVVISKLGSFEFPVAKRLGELWQFPSDHPPIAAKLRLGKYAINVASWNVLNRNYYKYIDADTQGLKGSQITTLHEAERRESTIVEKIEEVLLRKNFHILCLQECWPELLAQLKEALGGTRQFEIHCTGQEDDKNQEALRGIYFLKILHQQLQCLSWTFCDDHSPGSAVSDDAGCKVGQESWTHWYWWYDMINLVYCWLFLWVRLKVFPNFAPPTSMCNIL